MVINDMDTHNNPPLDANKTWDTIEIKITAIQYIFNEGLIDSISVNNITEERIPIPIIHDK